MRFGHYAQYYDLLYQEKDYAAEIDFLKEVGQLTPGISILDLGCGTGGHDIPLAEEGFMVTGIDISPNMISRAKQKATQDLSRATFLEGDIRTIRLGKTFGVVVSMFAVMGYQTANDDFVAALRTARAHLLPAGLFIFDAWFGPAVLSQRPATRVKELWAGDERILRIAEPELNALDNTVTIHYSVLKLARERVLDETRETHTMRFFFAPEVAHFASAAGFEVSKSCPFMDANRQPSERDWNVTWVLSAI